ncbi:hypothetical protein [Bradyrhizobium sp. NC92]|uniref:hypothetical protein n=1 Tax=Bradyrhizobium sp. (strain NC92) TaxID=55395 RepID=UPI0021AA22B8|nr:hypothetical protein [Bradyrhizobium sp. NC92]UWU66929.1 hypothetical protein N2602_27270 [Bradyrhizobium sp. NC92]
MVGRYARKDSAVDLAFFDTPLVPTERRDDLLSLRRALIQDIRPVGILEEIFVLELAGHIWEMQRLGRSRTLLINLAIENALCELISRISDDLDEAECAALARAWLTDSHAKRQVLKLLAAVKLDEEAIVARATMDVFEDLQRLDRMLSQRQARREKLLRSLVEYRKNFAAQVQLAMARTQDRLLLETTVAQAKS